VTSIGHVSLWLTKKTRHFVTHKQLSGKEQAHIFNKHLPQKEMGIAHGIILFCKYMWFGMPAAH